jgi:hypothetical protein
MLRSEALTGGLDYREQQSDKKESDESATQERACTPELSLCRRHHELGLRIVAAGQSAAALSEAPVVINQQRGEKAGQIDDRIAKGTSRQPVAVVDVKPDRVRKEQAVQG